MTTGLFTFIGVLCIGALTIFAAAWLGGIIYDYFFDVKKNKIDALVDDVMTLAEAEAERLAKKASARQPEALPGGYRDAAKPSLEEEIRALKDRVGALEGQTFLKQEQAKKKREAKRISKSGTIDEKALKETLDSLPIGYRVRVEEREAAIKLEKTLDEANKVVAAVASGNWKSVHGRG